ncbi:MAG: hypothetical protein AB8B53_15340 [Flavobacteriales bacterium]
MPFKLILSGVLLLLFSCATHASLTLEETLVNMAEEILQVKTTFLLKKKEIHAEIKLVDSALQREKSQRKAVKHLMEKELLRTQLEEVEFQEEFEICKVRYVKGLQVVKILYEKVLSLDHHFASARTFSEINKLSNPNSFQEFSNIKDLLKDHKKKGNNLELPDVLGGNVFASFAEVLINISGSDLSEKEKTESLSEVECILDFTLRMYNDLHIIYFETSYLQASNEDIKHNIETLFKEYTKSINYKGQLSECRLNDDWEGVEEHLDEYIAEALEEGVMIKSELLVNLKFPIDRLVQFINQYNAFIDDGKKYYQKFDIILASYENEELCQESLPIEFARLRNDMDIAVEKFGIAYKPVEINGSRMKEILYGVREF